MPAQHGGKRNPGQGKTLGRNPDPGKRVTKSFRLLPATVAWLKKASKERGVTMTAIVEGLVTQEKMDDL